MRILITGGAGYIGSHATRRFLERGHDVWIYDNLSRGHRLAVPSERLIVGDLADSSKLVKILLSDHIDAIAHFAAVSCVGESLRDPGLYYHNNVAGTLSLLEAAMECGLTRLVLSSSAAVYGNQQAIPIDESAECRPINPYGRSKLMIEELLPDFAAAHGLGYAVLRYFNAAGASPAGDIGECHDPETHLIPIILQVAMGLRPCVEIFGTDFATSDGTCIRDFVHVDDLADAHVLALERIQPGAGEIFNLGSGRGSSVLEVIDVCRQVTGKDIPVKVLPARAGDPAVLVASHQTATQRLGWKHRYKSLREIVESAWHWHSSYPHGYRLLG